MTRNWTKKYSASDQPEESCPYIDPIQNALENVRRINSELRSWGIAGWEHVEELEADLMERDETIRKLER